MNGTISSNFNLSAPANPELLAHSVEGAVFTVDGTANSFTHTFADAVDAVTIQNRAVSTTGVFFRITVTAVAGVTLAQNVFFVSPESSEQINFKTDENLGSVIAAVQVEAVAMTATAGAASVAALYTWPLAVEGKVTGLEY